MRVLVVEDHKRLAEAVAAGLRDEGMAVDVVFDGQDALDHVALTRYDVVVLDRDLPGRHGDEVCKALAAGRCAARMLMLDRHRARRHAHHPGPARGRPARPAQLPGRHRDRQAGAAGCRGLGRRYGIVMVSFSHGWGGQDVALTGHALAETYSVLTRLPGDARLAPADAARLLTARFSAPLLLNRSRARKLPDALARGTYDAVGVELIVVT
jgi:CheY-like chemotaxis protein